MSKQLTVRLPDSLVEFIDRRIEEGKATSRAGVVASAIERERRRALAERDVAILAANPGNDDLDGLATYAARTQLSDLD